MGQGDGSVLGNWDGLWIHFFGDVSTHSSKTAPASIKTWVFSGPQTEGLHFLPKQGVCSPGSLILRESNSGSHLYALC